MFRRYALCLLAFSASIATSIEAQTVYVYRNQLGLSVITDRKRNEPGLKLIKEYTPVASIEVLGPRHYDLSRRQLKPRDTEYDKLIFSLADSYRLDRALIKAIVQVESSFNPRALSPKGAQGLMQLMPATASSYKVVNPYDAGDNLRGGIAFFSDLMRRYDNDVRLALAAYNAGETAVSRYRGIPPFAETQAYVKYVLELHRNYQNHDGTYS